ncbi:uncharacterized protein POS17_2334 [Pseudomonas sp. Os17]|uniref:hypothetical protein n=1 Tax=Pseudomonas TaxID=286 RepID=UPI0005FCB6E2|nr:MULTISPECIES: hypothetical protein [Pseudomonas]RXU60181.1 hypothetical protein CW358_28865 [Pseudomonas protegens]BAQ74028.1 uncharacterized protein POS17_2334 [Pseudomonas sp. Os17]
MTSSHVCNPIPLTRNDTDHPVLYLDANASWTDLYTCAQQRIGAARNLLEILDCASGPQDLSQIRFAIGLLLSDGFDLLRTLGDRTLRQADPA